MTIQELNTALDGVAKDLQGNSLGNIMVKIGSDARYMIDNRVRTTGTNAEGQKYAPYSTTSMLANCSSMTTGACSQIAGSKAKRRELKWVTLQKGGRNIRLFELPGGYKQYRELHNHQTGFVDFAFTNRMWNNIKVVSDKSEANQGRVRISTTDDTEQKKLAGNTNRRGAILKLSDSEITGLAKQLNDEIRIILEKNGTR